jgi:hypothetical protein
LGTIPDIEKILSTAQYLSTEKNRYFVWLIDNFVGEAGNPGNQLSCVVFVA